MPVLIEQDTNLPRVIASGSDSEGNQYTETESVVYAKGQVVYEDDLTDDVLEALEDGDESFSSVAKLISESEAERILAEQAGVQVAVAPEHEAEAEVLYQDGQDVLTRDEVVELNPNGDEVAVAEEAPDLTENREAKAPDSVRSQEVDAKRRGKAKAPAAKPAAKESGKAQAESAPSEPASEPAQSEPASESASSEGSAKSEPAKPAAKSASKSK